MKHCNVKYSLALLLALTAAAAQGPRELKPGWNMFSKEQDIQLGREAAAQVAQQLPLVRNSELVNQVQRIGAKLASTPEAAGFPYTFQVVADKSINAFALPGGPTFVHTGLITAADNEAQLAGVLAHEIAHVALRHGTNQASKANLIQLPVMLASGMLGSGSLLSQLGQLGIGLGANSVLLKFSRNAETEADLLGARMMAKAGYNPLEMARFFEKLEAEGGSRGPQFLSDHPNPGNRVKAVEAEIRYLPQANYSAGNNTEFSRMQKLAASVPAPGPRQSAARQAGGGGALPRIPVSRNMREYRGGRYSISYPDNWQAAPSEQNQGVTLAPREGYVESGGQGAIGVGAVVGFARGTGDLRRDTEELMRQLASQNSGMRMRGNMRNTRVAGQNGAVTTLESASPFANETEVDTLITAQHPDGLFYVVLIAPQSLMSSMSNTFNAMVNSIRF